ncbi:MAG TPA: rhodanese-like domain-containing protein [Gammaproteobacteria bacterium]|nr:rhodanese-like domain-containing protein [Gammaproteobacteria bacterium]
MKTYNELVNDCLAHIEEVFPWDLAEETAENPELLLIDVSEPYEYARAHIPNALNVPRGILESACEYDYDETVPELAAARKREVVVICRSGRRSALAAYTLQLMGFQHVRSLKTGLRGWNDDEYPLVDAEQNPVDPDTAEDYFTPKIRPEQHSPGS